MRFLERRRWRKIVTQLLHEAHHVYRMRADLMSAGQIHALREAISAVRIAWREKNPRQLTATTENLSDMLTAINPPHAWPRLKENVEVFTVALAVAMAFRTYFVQPFKIPTASMQPTLYGITVQAQEGRRLSDYFPLNLIKMALFGEKYVEVRAKVSGEVLPFEQSYDRETDTFRVLVSGVPHAIRRGMRLYVVAGERVQSGQLLASGRIRIGDHIFVDKVRYNFARPKRGDIIVFSTDGIVFPDIRQNSFYIKRLAALPNERVALVPPYLLVNGKRVLDPAPFRRLVDDKVHGYHGYTLVNPQYAQISWLPDSNMERTLQPNQFLPLGDNSRHSLDGRYFGPITAENLVGPAFLVYWPLGPRWGWVR